VTITGATRVYALLGDPLHKARSPEHFNAVIARAGVDAVLVPLETQDFDHLVRALKATRNCGGLILTMPYKQAMLRHLDEFGPSAQKVGVVNVARRLTDGRWTGEIYDGAGYADALRAKGVRIEGSAACMLGCGAVARAMAVALAEAGLARLTVKDTQAAQEQALIALLREHFPGLRCAAGEIDPQDHDIAINATPLGMADGDPLPFEPAAKVVSDVTTKPEITPLLAAARQRGCTITSGADMFNAQAARIAAFFGWTSR
jgi:shikimate dehydrogenase